MRSTSVRTQTALSPDFHDHMSAALRPKRGGKPNENERLTLERRRASTVFRYIRKSASKSTKDSFLRFFSGVLLSALNVNPRFDSLALHCVLGASYGACN